MKAMQLTATDNVATVLSAAEAGNDVEIVLNGNPLGVNLTALEPIPFGFKICSKAMKKGDDVVKYGHVIGRATCDIAAGALVHVHNIEGCRGRGDLNH